MLFLHNKKSIVLNKFMNINFYLNSLNRILVLFNLILMILLCLEIKIPSNDVEIKRFNSFFGVQESFTRMSKITNNYMEFDDRSAYMLNESLDFYKVIKKGDVVRVNTSYVFKKPVSYQLDEFQNKTFLFANSLPSLFELLIFIVLSTLVYVDIENSIVKCIMTFLLTFYTIVCFYQHIFLGFIINV